MTAPVLSRLDDVGDRLYRWGIPPEGFYSVTTLIAGGVPKYLVPWASKAVTERVLEDLAARSIHSRATSAIRAWTKAGRLEVIERQAAGELRSLNVAKMSPRELAARFLKREPERIRDRAATLGIDVHDAAEYRVLQALAEHGRAYAAGKREPSWPPDLAGHMRSFGAFLEVYRPEFLATEATVFNRAQGYAGTLDAIVVILVGGRPMVLIIDYKSGREIYPEVALQLAAYSRAEFVGGADGVTEHPLPAIDAGAVLHVRADGEPAVPRLVRIDDAMFRAFLHAREVFRWRKELARTALLQPLAPPLELEAVGA